MLDVEVLSILLCLICSFIFAQMAKKSSKKTPSQVQEITVVEEQKPSSAHKKLGSEIDEIFASKKRKKSEAEKSEDATKKPKKSKQNIKKKRKESTGVENFSASRSRKKTADGFTIYTEEELGINKADAGSTPLCPFDCSCCF